MPIQCMSEFAIGLAVDIDDGDAAAPTGNESDAVGTGEFRIVSEDAAVPLTDPIITTHQGFFGIIDRESRNAMRRI